MECGPQSRAQQKEPPYPKLPSCSSPTPRPLGHPQPLPYLDAPANRAAGALDIQLQVELQTARMRAAARPGAVICRTNYRHGYWTVAQMVAHHSVNGRNLQTGSLFGSGTLSGPTARKTAALIELTQGGKKPLSLPGGERRTWLEDGHSVTLRAWCEKPEAASSAFGELHENSAARA